MFLLKYCPHQVNVSRITNDGSEEYIGIEEVDWYWRQSLITCRTILCFCDYIGQLCGLYWLDVLKDYIGTYNLNNTSLFWTISGSEDFIRSAFCRFGWYRSAFTIDSCIRSAFCRFLSYVCCFLYMSLYVLLSVHSLYVLFSVHFFIRSAFCRFFIRSAFCRFFIRSVFCTFFIRSAFCRFFIRSAFTRYRKNPNHASC